MSKLKIQTPRFLTVSLILASILTVCIFTFLGVYMTRLWAARKASSQFSVSMDWSSRSKLPSSKNFSTYFWMNFSLGRRPETPDGVHLYLPGRIYDPAERQHHRRGG